MSHQKTKQVTLNEKIQQEKYERKVQHKTTAYKNCENSHVKLSLRLEAVVSTCYLPVHIIIIMPLKNLILFSEL